MSRRHTLQLPSGLRILVTECPHLHTVALSAIVRVGSRHEDSRSWGLTHLVEHMLFRGSVAYPSPQALVAPFERSGGTLSAETWRDHTHFSATLHPSGLGPALAALGDMLTRPLWQDLPAERALVQAEMQADLDGDDDDAGEADLTNLGRAAVWRNHPMGRRITGSPRRLRAFSQRMLIEHHRRHYHAGNVVVSIAGPVRAKVWLKKVAAAFAHLSPMPAANSADAVRLTPPTFAANTRPTRRDVATNQVALSLSYEALADTHPDFVALQLLAAVLDDGMGTRLHRALSERTGLVYAFHSGLDCYHDTGLYELEMQVAPSRTAAALACALETLQELALRGVTLAELQAAKGRADMADEMGRDDSCELAYDAALDAAFARPSPEARRAHRAQVSCHDLQRIAKKLFLQGRRHVTWMGPTAQVDTLAMARSLRGHAPARSANLRARAAALPKKVATGRSKKPRRG